MSNAPDEATPQADSPAAGKAPRGSPWRALAADIKLAHTVFALPFALLGMVLAARWAGRWPTLIELALILLCMVSARTFAMLFNRLADASLDGRNPRTAGRAIPSGRLPRATAVQAAALSAGLFVLGACGFWALAGNPWPIVLSPVVLAWLAFYSLTKRFTWLCHVALGVALAISPVAAALAIEPGYLAAEPTAWLIAGMVLGWVAGFDVIYAMQDVAVDRALSLFSMPASLGETRALVISGVLHATAAVLLFVAGWVSPTLGWLFGGACLVVLALLVLEHTLVWRSGTRHLDMAFFTVNGIVSVIVGVIGIIDAGI